MCSISEPYRAWKRRAQAEMMKRNRDYAWQEQHCIILSKIAPDLSVEAYYRSQEAKSVQPPTRAMTTTIFTEAEV